MNHEFNETQKKTESAGSDLDLLSVLRDGSDSGESETERLVSLQNEIEEQMAKVSQYIASIAKSMGGLPEEWQAQMKASISGQANEPGYAEFLKHCN